MRPELEQKLINGTEIYVHDGVVRRSSERFATPLFGAKNSPQCLG
jgi:hypothetical protein